MLGLIYNGEVDRARYSKPRVTAETLRTKIMPEYTIPTRLPGIVDVKELPGPNGETIKVATDENGEIIATETKPNWLPLILAGGAAAFFLM